MQVRSHIQIERHGTYLNAGLEYPASYTLLVLVRYARYEQHSGGEDKVGAPDDENCTREAKGPVRCVDLDYRKEEAAKARCNRSSRFYRRLVSGRVGAFSNPDSHRRYIPRTRPAIIPTTVKRKNPVMFIGRSLTVVSNGV